MSENKDFDLLLQMLAVCGPVIFVLPLIIYNFFKGLKKMKEDAKKQRERLLGGKNGTTRST